MVEKATEKQWEQLGELLGKYRGTKGSVIPVLQQAEEIFGYLPKDVLIEISNQLEVPISQIYGVVTFYAQFYLNPRGKNIIRSCQGTACHVRGAKAVLKARANNKPLVIKYVNSKTVHVIGVEANKLKNLILSLKDANTNDVDAAF